MFSYLSDFISFVRFPTYSIQKETKVVRNIIGLLIILVVTEIIVWGSSFILKYLAGPVIVFDADYNLTDAFRNLPLWRIILTGVVIGPVIEELLYRAQLQFRPVFFSLFIAGFFDIVFSLMILPLLPHIIMEAIIFLSVWYFASRIEVKDKLLIIWQRYFRTIFYVTALYFAISHIFRNNISLNMVTYAIIICLPQFIFGISLGYIRVKSGLLWSIILHSLGNNLIGVIPLLFSAGLFYSHNAVITIEKPTGWVNYSKLDIDTNKIKLIKENLVWNYDNIYQKVEEKTAPTMPYIITSHENNREKENIELKKEAAQYGKILKYDSNANLYSIFRNLTQNKILYDSTNNRIFMWVKKVKGNETITDAKIIYLRDNESLNLDFVTREEDFYKYEGIFNRVVNSAKIEPDNTRPLVMKKLKTQISGITKQSIGWREIPGILIWLCIIFALVKITITDKNKHEILPS